MACALTLAKDGAAGISIADLNLAAARAVAAKCQQVATNPKFRTEATHVDVTDEGSVKAAAASIASILGRIDYCVHCAGVRVLDLLPACLHMGQGVLEQLLTANRLVRLAMSRSPIAICPSFGASSTSIPLALSWLFGRWQQS
jgi:NAD(P)-dependent dehydrogenase (short-subunit alcohol dehydrogenase family)